MGMLTNKDVLRHTVQDSRGRAPARPGSSAGSPSSMTADVITIGSDEDVRVAANQMTTFGVGGLVVNDLPTGR